MATTDAVTGSARAGKYLTFDLAGREYGLGILKVQEIHGLMGLSRTPELPPFVQGVIDLRGKDVPVVSLRERLGLPEAERTPKTCIVVVQAEHDGTDVNLGIVVDEVEEVLALREDQIDDAAEGRAGGDAAGTIMGSGRTADREVALLDVDALLSGAELASVAGLVEAG